MNLLNNPSFEEGAYEWQDHDNIRIPNDWIFSHADDSVFNEWDENNTPFAQPEASVLHKSDIPPHEWEDFFVTGDHTWKCFGFHRSIWVYLLQHVSLDIARYRFTVHVNPDLYDENDGSGNKVPAIDPLTGQIQFIHNFDGTEFQTMQPYLEMNTYSWEFDAYAPGPHTVGISVRLPHPLKSNGIFADAFKLIALPDPTPREYERTIHLVPQKVGDKEFQQVVEAALPKRQSITFSADDALITHPNLTVRNVIAWNAGRMGGKVELRKFAKTYYPPQPNWTWRRFKKDVEPPPDPDPPPLPVPNIITSLHMQNSEHGWVEYVRDVQPAVVKLVHGFERAWEVKAASPDTLVWIRQVDDDTGKYIGTQPNGYEDKPPPDVAARQFLNTFWPEGETPSWVGAVDIVSGLNETIATGNTLGTQSAVAFEVAFSDLVASLGIPYMKASLLATAVGNPGHNEVELLLPAAQAAIRNGHYIDGHLYFPCSFAHAERWMEEEGLHHHMRSLLSWDPVFNEHGLYPMYLSGECGAIGAYVREDLRPGGYVGAGAGFRHSSCLGGDWPRYLNLILRHKEMIDEWNASHGNRFRGMTIFTCVHGSWKNFNLYEEQLNTLAWALTQ